MAADGDELVTLCVEDGAFVSVPVYESHKRGINWMARIDINPKAPGGLDRIFVDKAHGEFFYMADITVNDPVEFAADYISGGGHRIYRRWYGVVVEVTDGHVVVQKLKSGREAVKRARVLRQDATA